MKTYEIKHRFNSKVFFSGEFNSFKECAEEAVRQRANLRWADLREANLRWADLQRANLRWADLREADLRWVNLRWADLRKADLREADLRKADLRWADLRWADLRETNLRWADLREADLRWADLDLSSGIPFWCGGTSAKIDDRIFAQMLYHLTRMDVSEASGGVQEAMDYIRQMAAADLFCEYREDVQKL